MSDELPLGEWGGQWLDRARLICHVLLLETDDGLMLVDSGLGTADMADPSTPFCAHDPIELGRLLGSTLQRA